MLNRDKSRKKIIYPWNEAGPPPSFRAVLAARLVARVEAEMAAMPRERKGPSTACEK
jgi:hypothetical protein